MEKDDVIHFWWNPQARRYEEGDKMGPREDYGPAYVAPTKKLLEDTGTRFAHLNDLTEYLSEGLVAVTNSLARYKNDADADRKTRLEAALNLIRVYQEQLANYAGQKWEFNKMLDAFVPSKETLAAIRAERLEQAKANPKPEKSLEKKDDEGSEDSCV